MDNPIIEERGHTLDSMGVSIAGTSGYWRGIVTVVALDLQQRLRTRGWYTLLAVWSALLGLVTLPNLLRSGVQGTLTFDLLAGFVLSVGLGGASVLSARAINGGQSKGVSAALQIAGMTPGQLILGKFVASWVAALAFLMASVPFMLFAVAWDFLSVDGLLIAVVTVVMLAIELGVVCAIGVGISARKAGPVSSIATTYLVVGFLCIGTVMGFGMGQSMVKEEVTVPLVKGGEAATSPTSSFCGEETKREAIRHSDRIAWMLAANPYLLVADAMPYPLESSNPPFLSMSVTAALSYGVRHAQAGPALTVPCLDGDPGPADPRDLAPLWPLGLAIQLLLASWIMWLGQRRLVKLTKRLSQGAGTT